MVVHEGFVDSIHGVRLYYRRMGDAPEVLVVLHGGPGFSMEYLAEDLAFLAESRSLLFYDQRGAGRSTLVSDPAALDAHHFAEDLERVRAHFGLDRLTVLGHSWGAGVAALYAGKYPHRIDRLIVVGGIPLSRHEFDRTFRNLDAARTDDSRQLLQQRREAWHADPGNCVACRAYYEEFFRPFFGHSDSQAKAKGDFCAGTAEALRNKVRNVDRYTVASLADWDWRPILARLSAPALIIHGTEDVISMDSARQWAAALPNGRLLALERVGHFPYVESPERFVRAVDAFLAGRWPDGAEMICGPEPA